MARWLAITWLVALFLNLRRLRWPVWADFHFCCSVGVNNQFVFIKAPEQSGAFLLPPFFSSGVGRNTIALPIKPDSGRAELPLRQRRGTAPLPQPNPAGLRCRAAFKPKTNGRAELPLRQRRGTAALPQPNPAGLALPRSLQTKDER